MAQLKDKVGSFFAWALKSKDPVSVDVTRREAEGEAKEVSIQQIKQGYGEVVETVQSVRSHLQQQADRSERMLELLNGLPELMESLPQQARNQAGMLEAIHRHLDDQNQTSRQLTDAIAGLATASAHQQRSLTSIDEHLAEGHESRTQLNKGVGALTDTLGEVRASNAATRESMGAVVEQTRVNDERMREMFQRSQKMNTMMVMLCLALATGALALAAYVAVLASRMVDGPTDSTPTSSEAPVIEAAPSSAGIDPSPALSTRAYSVAPEIVDENLADLPSDDAEPAMDWVGPPSPSAASTD